MKCWLGFHKWTNWGELFRFGYNAKQNRRCVRCGLSQQRDAGFYNDNTIADIPKTCDTRHKEEQK